MGPGTSGEQVRGLREEWCRLICSLKVSGVGKRGSGDCRWQAGEWCDRRMAVKQVSSTGTGEQ